MCRQLNIADTVRLEIGRYKNRKRRKHPVLQQLFWECTLRCNLHCQHCGSDCRTEGKVEDMPLHDFLPILDDVAKIAQPHRVMVITTGGEPLARQDIAECGREITKRGFIWGMVSNGMLLTADKLDQLIEAGLKTIAISLDGFKDEHNWMRGHESSFDKAVAAVRALAERCITWDVITCVNQRNIGRLDEFKEFLTSIGVKRWRIFTVFPSGRAKGNEELQLSPVQLEGVMDFIAAARRDGRIHVSYGCEGFLGKYEHRVRDHQFFCQAGVHVASILADGSISGCLSIRSNFHQGNIYKDRFSDVWLSRFQEYRNHDWMKTEECASCKFWRYCEGNGMHLRDEEKRLLLCNLRQLRKGKESDGSLFRRS